MHTGCPNKGAVTAGKDLLQCCTASVTAGALLFALNRSMQKFRVPKQDSFPARNSSLNSLCEQFLVSPTRAGLLRLDGLEKLRQKPACGHMVTCVSSQQRASRELLNSYRPYTKATTYWEASSPTKYASVGTLARAAAPPGKRPGKHISEYVYGPLNPFSDTSRRKVCKMSAGQHNSLDTIVSVAPSNFREGFRMTELLYLAQAQRWPKTTLLSIPLVFFWHWA